MCVGSACAILLLERALPLRLEGDQERDREVAARDSTPSTAAGPDDRAAQRMTGRGSAHVICRQATDSGSDAPGETSRKPAAVYARLHGMSRAERTANLIGVVVPFLGLLAAVVLLWNQWVDWTDLAIMVVTYLVFGLRRSPSATTGCSRTAASRPTRACSTGWPCSARWASRARSWTGSPTTASTTPTPTRRAIRTPRTSATAPASRASGTRTPAGCSRRTARRTGRSTPPSSTRIRACAASAGCSRGSRYLSLAIPTALGFVAARLHARGRAARPRLGRPRAGVLPAPRDVVDQLDLPLLRAAAGSTSRTTRPTCSGSPCPRWARRWHHNHHAFPRSAAHGLGRWEIDLSACVIRVMEKVGLAWNVVRIAPERQAAKLIGAPSRLPAPRRAAEPQREPAGVASSGPLDRPAAHAAGRLALGALAGRPAAGRAGSARGRRPPAGRSRRNASRMPPARCGESSMPSSAAHRVVGRDRLLAGTRRWRRGSGRRRPGRPARRSRRRRPAHQQEHAARADPLELRAAEEALVVGGHRRRTRRSRARSRAGRRAPPARAPARRISELRQPRVVDLHRAARTARAAGAARGPRSPKPTIPTGLPVSRNASALLSSP